MNEIKSTLKDAEIGDTIEELIDKIYMLVDPDLELQLYEDTAEIRDC